MITNNNASKMPASGEMVDIKKFIGVASVNVLAVNPNNNTLRKYGWVVADGAAEPNYVTVTERDGKPVTSARVRFLVQIQDINGKPVIPLDFWIRPEYSINATGDKCKIIDSFGRTAWATKEEVKSHAIPQYANGPASISNDYKPCHGGQEELVAFLMKYLNVTPYRIFDRNRNEYVDNKNPGRLTIDNWDKLVKGDATEIAEYLSLQPENMVKVVLAVRTNDENKSYQTFLNSVFIGNGAVPDRNTGEYTSATKAIDKLKERGGNYENYIFSAAPVKEWTESATDVKDNADDVFDSSNTVRETFHDDLPFD